MYPQLSQTLEFGGIESVLHWGHLEAPAMEADAEDEPVAKAERAWMI